MSGKKSEPPAQTKRSSRLAAKEEAVVDTRKRGRSSTGDDSKRGAASAVSVQSQPSKRGKTEAPAPAERSKGSPVPTRSQPPAVTSAPLVQASKQQTAVGGVTATPTQPAVPNAVIAPKVSPAPAAAPAALPARSSERRDASHGLGGVLAAAQARKEASFNTQSIAPQRGPNNATATRKSSATVPAVPSSLPLQQPVIAKVPQASPVVQPHQQQSPQNNLIAQPKQRVQPQAPTLGQAPKAGAVQQKVNASVAPMKPLADGKNWQGGVGKDCKTAPAVRAGTANLKGKPTAGAAAPGADKIPKIVIKQGGQAVAPERRPAAPVPMTPAQEAATGELRKGLWLAVEKWLAARAALPGDGQDRFKSELKRLCQQLVFDQYSQSQREEDGHFEHDRELGSLGDRATMTRESSVCKFGFRVAANHPRPPPQMILEATTYIFSAESVMGKTGKGIKELRWRTELELAGILSISFDSQTMQVDEDVDAELLQQIKNTLATELTLSELGVLLLIAGLCCRSQAAWYLVEDVCFWSHNFTLPEFQSAQCDF